MIALVAPTDLKDRAVSSMRTQQRPISNTPDVQHAVKRAAGQELPVWRESAAVNLLGVLLQAI